MYMGGVDKFDQHMSYYSIYQKSRRWWIKLFYYFLESAIVNAFIIYRETMKKENQKPMSHLQFRRRLDNELIGTYSSRKRTGYTPGKAFGRKRNHPDGYLTIQNNI